MSETSTPETDGEIVHKDGEQWIKPSFARKLEMERNEALRKVKAALDRISYLERQAGYDPLESGR